MRPASAALIVLVSAAIAAAFPPSTVIPAADVVLRGRVTDSKSGEAIAKATVVITVDSTTFSVKPPVGPDGRFAVSLVRRAGTSNTNISVSAAGYATSQISIPIDAATPDTLPIVMKLLPLRGDPTVGAPRRHLSRWTLAASKGS